jgi:hypothetical protein
MEAKEDQLSRWVDDEGAGREMVGEALAPRTVRMGLEMGEEVVAETLLR